MNARSFHVAVIGDGIAGYSTAMELIQRGHTCAVIGNSRGGNIPAHAILWPSLPADPHRALLLSSALREAFTSYSSHRAYDPCGVLLLDDGSRHQPSAIAGRLRDHLPTQELDHLTAHQAADISGVPLRCGGVLVKSAGVLRGHRYLENIRLNYPLTIIKKHALRWERSGCQWLIHLQTGETITADAVILTIGTSAADHGLPVTSVAGAHFHAATDNPPRTAICGRASYGPSSQGAFAGSLYTRSVDLAEDASRDWISRKWPSVWQTWCGPDAEPPPLRQSHVGFRAQTPDHLPIVDRLDERLVIITGLGSRGVLWAPLCARLAVSLITHARPNDERLIHALRLARLTESTTHLQ